MADRNNAPQTTSAALSLAGTIWKLNGNHREIIRIENASISRYDNRTVLAEVYWRNLGGKERRNPTQLTTFRTWLNKATFVERLTAA